MNIEKLKEDFIKLKKEELAYLDNTAKLSFKNILSQEEKLNIYRKIKYYENENIKYNKLFLKIIFENDYDEDYDKILIEIKLDPDFLSKINKNLSNEYKKLFLKKYNIDMESNCYILKVIDILDRNYVRYRYVDFDIILNRQKLFEKDIYLFAGYYDHSEDCYGPLFGDPEDYIDGIYESIYYESIYYDDIGKVKVPKKDMPAYEKDKTVVHIKEYVYPDEVKAIFSEELLNEKNKTLEDCANSTILRVNKLSYLRSPGYKEKVLLEKITNLYEKVKGNLTKEEILYSGDFIKLIKEVYNLPNNKTITREKIVKNGGKDSVIIVAESTDGKYILTFQNRINDKIIAEFPSGYIEDGETFIETAKRELKEETGYVSNNVTLLEKSYYSVGIDNSIFYIVYMRNSVKAFDVNPNENLTYGLFTEEELNYLFKNNIMCGSLNKLAYYSMQNNVYKRVLSK